MVYNKVYSKRSPVSPARLTDYELLSVVLGSSQAARTVLDEIGSLSQFSSMGQGARLMSQKGISKGTAIRLDCLFELACRIG